MPNDWVHDPDVRPQLGGRSYPGTALKKRSTFNSTLRFEAGEVAGQHPGFIELRVFDGFAGGITINILGQVAPMMVIAVADVHRSVLGLNDGRIMVSAGFGARRVNFQMPLPFPGAPLVVGDLNRQTVASAFGVIADEDPVAVTQSDDLGA